MKPTKITIMTWNIFTDTFMKSIQDITAVERLMFMNIRLQNIIMPMNIITEGNIIMPMNSVMEGSLMRITMRTGE